MEPAPSVRCSWVGVSNSPVTQETTTFASGRFTARLFLLGVVAAAAVAVPSALAKDFRPGDVSVCNTERCVPITKREVVAVLRPFYYSGSPPARMRTPGLGAASFELRFENGYATGIVATAKLDRFLSYGVHLGYFRRGAWYRVPPLLARELRRLTAALRPLSIMQASFDKSR